MNKIEVAAGVIIILLLVGITYYLSKPTTYAPSPIPTTGQASLLSFRITDPPEVPNGTSSLIIYYSSLNAHVILANGTSEWVGAQGSGSINLLSLVNMSEVMGSASIPRNSTVDMVKFNITKATITINNKTYNVTIPNQEVSVHITNSNKVNGTASVLIDMTPVVATIYTNNSVIFVLVPSLRGVVVGGSATGSASVGSTQPINATEREELELSRPNITLYNVTLSESNNITTLRVGIENNANTSVKIMHIMLIGNMSVEMNLSSFEHIKIEDGIIHIKRPFNNSDMQIPGQGGLGGLGGSANIIGSGFGLGAKGAANISGNLAGIYIGENGVKEIENALNISEMNLSEIEKLSEENISRVLSHINTSEVEQAMKKLHGFNISESELEDLYSNKSNPAFNAIIGGLGIANEEDELNISIQAEHFRTINFLVSQNGTLVLPFAQGELPLAQGEYMQDFEEGYTLPAHGKILLTFTGKVSFAKGHITLNIIPGESYKVVAVGDEGAHASTNITAG